MQGSSGITAISIGVSEILTGFLLGLKRGEATHSIALLSCNIFFCMFSAQKSHVKPLNHLIPYGSITSAWHFSYTQPAILDI
jgi:hypothetical protein